MPAVDLDRLAAHLPRRVAHVGLRHRGGHRRVLGVRVQGPGRVVGRRVGVLHLEEHLGAPVPDGLEGADRLAELLPHLRVLDRHVEASPRRAEHRRRRAHRAAPEQARRGARPRPRPRRPRAARPARTPSSRTVDQRIPGSIAGTGETSSPAAPASTRNSASPSGPAPARGAGRPTWAHGTHCFTPVSRIPSGPGTARVADRLRAASRARRRGAPRCRARRPPAMAGSHRACWAGAAGRLDARGPATTVSRYGPGHATRPISSRTIGGLHHAEGASAVRLRTARARASRAGPSPSTGRRAPRAGRPTARGRRPASPARRGTRGPCRAAAAGPG